MPGYLRELLGVCVWVLMKAVKKCLRLSFCLLKEKTESSGQQSHELRAAKEQLEVLTYISSRKSLKFFHVTLYP